MVFRRRSLGPKWLVASCIALMATSAVVNGATTQLCPTKAMPNECEQAETNVAAGDHFYSYNVTHAAECVVVFEVFPTNDADAPAVRMFVSTSVTQPGGAGADVWEADGVECEEFDFGDDEEDRRRRLRVRAPLAQAAGVQKRRLDDHDDDHEEDEEICAVALEVEPEDSGWKSPGMYYINVKTSKAMSYKLIAISHDEEDDYCHGDQTEWEEIVFELLLWVVLPILLLVICIVTMCYCSKTCCFAPSQRVSATRGSAYATGSPAAAGSSEHQPLKPAGHGHVVEMQSTNNKQQPWAGN